MVDNLHAEWYDKADTNEKMNRIEAAGFISICAQAAKPFDGAVKGKFAEGAPPAAAA